MDWTKAFAIKNVAGGVVVIGALAIPSGAEKLIEPSRYTEKAVTRMKEFHANGLIEATNNVGHLLAGDAATMLPARDIEKEHSEHVVYDPEAQKEQFKSKKGIINVESFDTGKGIEVKNLNTESKAVGVKSELPAHNFDIEDAKNLLNLHWKTLEKTVANMTDAKALEYTLELAKTNGHTGKKVDIIENRIAELKN